MNPSSRVPAPGPHGMETLERLLAERHSCRGFLPDAVPRPVIERMLAAAQRTGSWCNAQPWRVFVLSGAETDRFRQALYAHSERAQGRPDLPFPREYRGVYLARRRECGYQLYDAVGVARGDRKASAVQARENFRLFGAPHVAVVSADEALGPYAAVDCGAWTANFLLAAQALGVAAVPQASPAYHSDFLHDYFATGSDQVFVCAVSFGYEDTAHPANAFRTTRAGLDETTTWLG